MAWFDLLDMLGEDDGSSPRPALDQLTALSVMALPGVAQSFSAKGEAAAVGQKIRGFLVNVGRLMNP